jgi:hypothetical protein
MTVGGTGPVLTSTYGTYQRFETKRANLSVL